MQKVQEERVKRMADHWITICHEHEIDPKKRAALFKEFCEHVKPSK